MTHVVNKRLEHYDVSISRDSLFGNPYRIGPDGTRKQVIKKHWDWLQEWILHKKEIIIGKWSNKWVVEHLYQLDEQVVGCFCKPRACHGDNLVELIGRFKMRGWPRRRTRKTSQAKIIESYHTQFRAAMRATSLGLCKRIIKHALEDEQEIKSKSKRRNT